MDFDPTRPIYLQIMEEVKKRAVRGRYAPGARLPSVRDMAAEMGVNPNTMSRAYSELEREGFLSARRGGGSYVTDDGRRVDAERESLAQAARQRFAEQIRDLELTAAQVKVLLSQIEKEVIR
jgi:GntR family transcriptional regulator